MENSIVMGVRASLSLLKYAIREKRGRRLLTYRLRRLLGLNIVECQVNGFPLIVNLADPTLGEILFVDGEFEKFEIDFLLGQVTPGMTVFVIGANIGLHVVPLAKQMAGKGALVAFEPDPVNLHFLRLNVERNGLSVVRIEPSAISSSESEITLYRSSVNLGNHRTYQPAVSDTLNQGLDYEEIKVRAMTVDGYCERTGLWPDLILMDIEGSEFQALCGMGQALSRLAGPLALELYPELLEQAGSSGEEILNKLHGEGFSFLELDEKERSVKEKSAAEILRGIAPQGLVNIVAAKRGWLESRKSAH